MKRVEGAKRTHWQDRVGKRGLVWHTVADKPYWHEGVHYSFAQAEIDEISAATKELYERFLEAGQAVVDDPEALTLFGIPQWAHRAIRDAWVAEPPALNYGRFDLGYDGKGPPKLFEFNCDTPTSLLEASVIQWDWKQDMFPKLGQYNDIHDHLVAKWVDIRSYLAGGPVHFVYTPESSGEDQVTTAYLRDTASAANLETEMLSVHDLGWHNVSKVFVDKEMRDIRTVYHLYPWEMILSDHFGPRIVEALPRMTWIEPIWKMMWSNKAILPVLHSMFPDHPNLLGAGYEKPSFGRFASKPFLAREGANVELLDAGSAFLSTPGPYKGPRVYQEMYDLPETAPGCYPVVGSWIVDGVPCGMGIREDGLITGNKARFVPHVVEG